MIIVSIETNPTSMSWFFISIGLLGGLALFLYGLSKLSDGLKKSAGEGMRKLLSTLTTNRLTGLLTGVFVTTIIQSSSATVVMLVSFVQAGLLSFAQSLGIILGADIGTTITAQLIAFQLDEYALLLIAFGFGLTIFSGKETLKHIGESIFGFGLLFFGMKLMSDSMAPLRTFEPFIQLLQGLEIPILGILAGTIFTAMIQSSSAFIGIIIVLAQQGVLTLEAGIPLMFGANLGTCITAWLASIKTTREAKRVALGHFFFKVAGILIFVFWIPYFADIIRNISPVSNVAGIGKLAAETPRQIANAHTLFNVSVGILFLPFTNLFGRLIEKILPDKPFKRILEPSIWYLDESSLHTPSLALDLARAELARMAKILKRMLDAIIYPLLFNQIGHDVNHPELTKIEGIELREKKIDFLQENITSFLLKIERRPLSDQQSREIFAMLSVVKSMENIGDIVQKSMIPLIRKKQQLKFDFSDEGKKDIKVIHEKVMKQLQRLQTGLQEKNISKARKIIQKESEYLHLESDVTKDHLRRVFERRDVSVATHELHMDIMECLRQINYNILDIAATILKSYTDIHTQGS